MNNTTELRDALQRCADVLGVVLRRWDISSLKASSNPTVNALSAILEDVEAARANAVTVLSDNPAP